MAAMPDLSAADRDRISAALRYMGRDLHHRSFAVSGERRELLWQEMDCCLALADQIDRQSAQAVQSPEFSASMTSVGSHGCSLITGASSGIGAAMATALAAEGRPLVLTARRGERLEALASRLRTSHGIPVHCLVHDLARPGGAADLLLALRQRGLAVHTLVNNAGFGLRGSFESNSWPQAEAMLQLMVQSAVQLCHGLLPAMQQQGGRILNVASLAGLVPGLPGSSLYSASKAFLIRFSQSLAAENPGGHIRVMALCPGYVHTEFHAVLGVQERMQRLPGLFWMEADQLAAACLQALQGRQVVCVPGAVNRLIAALAKVLPDAAGTALSSAFSRRYRSR